jgi:hypothetical protein
MAIGELSGQNIREDNLGKRLGITSEAGERDLESVLEEISDVFSCERGDRS